MPPPVTLPPMDGSTFVVKVNRCWEKLAATVLFESMVMLQERAPEQAPDQPPKPYPWAGEAVTVTVVPAT